MIPQFNQAHVHTVRSRLFIQRADKRILFMVRNMKDRIGTDHFTTQLPGGGVDPGETPDQAVVRETFEELLLMIQLAALELLHIYKDTRAADVVERAVWRDCKTITNEFHFYKAALPPAMENHEFELAEPEKFAIVKWCNRKELNDLVRHYKSDGVVSILGDGIADALESIDFP